MTTKKSSIGYGVGFVRDLIQEEKMSCNIKPKATRLNDYVPIGIMKN